jgi:hypothetical protein
MNISLNSLVAIFALGLGFSSGGCAPKKEAPPLQIPSVDPLMARRVSVDSGFKDAIVFNEATQSRDKAFAVTVNLLNRFDKPQRAVVRWEWFDTSGMKFSPGRNDKPQTIDLPGRTSVPVAISAPQPGVEEWKMFVTPLGKK